MKNFSKFIFFLIYFKLIGYVNYQTLQELTKLPINKIEVIMNELHAIESWNEGPCKYYHIFPQLINSFNLKKGAEVGVSTGGHSFALLEQTKIEKLYSIDPYCSNEYMQFSSDYYFDILFLRVKYRLGIFGSRSEMIRKFSLDAVHLFQDEELDFVFLDADHRYVAVKADLEQWYKKIRPGGIIGGDDYATIWPGVPQAVNEFFNALNLEVHTDKDQPRIWWVQKPHKNNF